jgi:hypothetical protein
MASQQLIMNPKSVTRYHSPAAKKSLRDHASYLRDCAAICKTPEQRQSFLDRADREEASARTYWYKEYKGDPPPRPPKPKAKPAFQVIYCPNGLPF